MIDANARLAQREGLGLKERLRAGTLRPAYTTVRDRPWACEDCGDVVTGRRGEGCGYCDGEVAERVSCDPLDLVRLLAFLGVEEAREIHPGEWGLCGCHESEGWCEHLEDPDDETPLVAHWGKRLERLASKLPPKRVEVAREHKPGCRHAGFAVSEWASCGCRMLPRTKVHDVPASRWLLVIAALDMARECLSRRREKPGCAIGTPHHGCCLECAVAHQTDAQIDEALDACAAWVEEATPEHRECWGLREFLHLPRWVPVAGGRELDGNTPAEVFQAAAKILSPEKVREIAAASIAGRLL